MVSWFVGWQTDWCADYKKNNKVTFLFHLLNAYRPIDSETFYRLKIGPLLTEIQPLLCRKCRTQLFFKCKLQNKHLFYFFFISTNWLGISYRWKKKSCCEILFYFLFLTNRLQQTSPGKIRQPRNKPTMAIMAIILTWSAFLIMLVQGIVFP